MRVASGILALIVIVFLNPVVGAGITASVAQAATVTQEYAAVQQVIGPAISAQQLMYPVMNAIGTEALQDAAVLQLSANDFMAAQNHPATMMDAIQRFFKSYGTDSESVYIIEGVNEQLNLIDLSSISPQQQADVVTRIITRPPASSYLQPAPPPPIRTPTPALPTRPEHCTIGDCIFPPASVFRFPDQIEGTTGGACYGWVGGCNGYTTTQDPTTTVLTYTWNGLPAGGIKHSAATYSVILHTSATFAQQATTRYKAATKRGEGNNNVPLVPLAHPVTSNEWMRGVYFASIQHCDYDGGMSWDNLEFQVGIFGDEMKGNRCLTWAQETLRRLLVRARGYSAVDPIFRSILPALERIATPVYLPSWLPTFKTRDYPFVVPQKYLEGLRWEVQLFDEPNCSALYCVQEYVLSWASTHIDQGWNRKADLGANGTGYIYLNEGGNSGPTIEWVDDGYAFSTDAPVSEGSPDQPTLVRIARSMVRVN